MSNLDHIPSDAAIVAAVRARRTTPDDYRELVTNYPDTYYQALDAARRLAGMPTQCEIISDHTGDYVTCGGCKVPLD